MSHTWESKRPTRFLALALVFVLLIAGCGGGKTQPTPKPSAPTGAAGPAQAPAQPTTAMPQPTLQPSRTATPLAQAAATSRPGKFVDPKELNSYRMKTTTWPKGEDKSKASVITTEWVKNPSAERIVMGETEIITIRDQTWVRMMGRWLLQDRATPQPQSSDISASIMRQIEDKFAYKEVGRETINGIACRHYTYSGEATIQVTEGALKGEVAVRGQGESWVADQPGLPQVVVRSRGESEMKMKAPAGTGATGDVIIAMSVETELYDINQPITITAPTDVFTPPTPPAAAATALAAQAGRATATRGAGQPTPPGLASLTPVPELKPCFDSFPIYPDAKSDAETTALGRMIAVAMGSPSESRGHQTAAAYAAVQAYYQTQPPKAGWQQGSPIVLQEGVQWWVKDQFLVALNLFPPSSSRKETRISVVCAIPAGAATAPGPTRTAGAATAAPTAAATVAAPAGTPTGRASTWDFDDPTAGGWYGEGGVDAAVGVDARPGYLRITAPSGNDLFPNTNLDAPTFFRVVKGDFTIETRLEFSPSEDYQGAGLLIWQDEENFVRLERCFGGIGGEGSGICFLKIADGEITSVAGAPQVATRAKAVELRLQRAGKRVSAWWRDASGATVGAWQSVGSSEIDLPGGEQPGATSALRAGVLLCVEGAEEIGADFDLFRLWGQ